MHPLTASTPPHLAAHPFARLSARMQTVLVLALLIVLSFIVFFAHHPLDRPLVSDSAAYALQARRIAHGESLYRAAFEIKTALSFLLGAAAIRAGQWFNVPDILSLRVVSMLLGVLSALLVYAVARQFLQSRGFAFVAACIWLVFDGMAILTASGIEPKMVMLCFGLASLWFTSRRHSLPAGICAVCAGLAWQVGWLYVPIVFILTAFDAALTPTAKRRALAFTLLGLLLPLVLYALYFAWLGVLGDMLYQSLWLPLQMGRTQYVWAIVPRVRHILRNFYVGYPHQVIWGILGAIGWLTLLVAALRRRTVGRLLRERHTGGVLLVFLGFVAYSLIDFQNWPDWLPLLPFFALACAWLLQQIWQLLATRVRLIAKHRPLFAGVLGALLLLFIFSDVSLFAAPPRITWRQQAAFAHTLQAQLPQPASLFALGKPELLFFMDPIPAGRFVLLVDHYDIAIERTEPQGFEGYLQNFKTQSAAVIILSRFKRHNFAVPARYDALTAWVTSHYTKLSTCRVAGGGDFFVTPALFPHLPRNINCP